MQFPMPEVDEGRQPPFTIRLGAAELRECVMHATAISRILFMKRRIPGRGHRREIRL